MASSKCIEIAVDAALTRSLVRALRGLIEIRDSTMDESAKLLAGKALGDARKELRGNG